jgi:hypothetical protein
MDDGESVLGRWGWHEKPPQAETLPQRNGAASRPTRLAAYNGEPRVRVTTTRSGRRGL